MRGTIYLVPVPIGISPDDKEAWKTYKNTELSPSVLDVIHRTKYFIVENEKTARRFLSTILKQEDLDCIIFECLNEHTNDSELKPFLEPILNGKDAAIISEAGCPCIADPGAKLVALAQKNEIVIVPLPGPSSILMSLMASGLGGQKFCFNGYLPADSLGREKALKQIENRSIKEASTEIFIETPYRNIQVFETALKTLRKDTLLCVASGISSINENILTKPISEWLNNKVKPVKIPTVFLLLGAKQKN